MSSHEPTDPIMPKHGGGQAVRGAAGGRAWTASRRRRTLLIAAAVVVAIAGSAWVSKALTVEDPPPWRMTEEQQVAKCLQDDEEMGSPVSRSVERMRLRKGGSWLAVFVSEPDNWVTVCSGGPDALMGNFGSTMGSGTADKVRFNQDRVALATAAAPTELDNQ